MKKTEKRDVEIKYCDFCEKETGHLEKCAVCKREMCIKDGGKFHAAYSVKIYRYKDGKNSTEFGNKVCKDCAGEEFNGTIQEFLDGMISEIPVIIKV